MLKRVLFSHLLVLILLSACAGGSGRQGTEIVVSGTGPTDPVPGGSNAVFVMTVLNSGPYDASNIKLIDNIGNQLKLISITCTAAGGGTCPATPSIQMTIPSLPNGGSLAFSVTVQLDSGATGIVQNTLTASFAEEIDPTGASAAVTATAVSTVTDVVVSGTGPAGVLVGGSAAQFIMTVTNNGPDAATNFNVYDNVGNGLTLVSITCTATGTGAECPAPASVGVLTAIPSLPAGGVLTFTVDTQVGANVNGTVTNQLVANISTNPTQSADSFYATATVVTADLTVSGTPPVGPLLPGSAAAFTMVVTNTGPGTAANIAFANVLSTNITASGAITCVPSGFVGTACPVITGSAIADLASMPSGGILTFTVPFTVNAAASGPVTDTLTVTSSTDARGPQSATVGLGAGSNFITVTQTTPSTVGAGTDAVFSAVVANTGPAVATNITVNYTLTGSAGTVATITCTAAAGIICPTPPLGHNMVIPSLGVGRAVNFTFTVPVPVTDAGGGAIVNTITATAIGNSDTTMNTAIASTQPVNTNNGTYTVFAANGFQYSLVVDFDAPASYTITGNGQNITSTFTGPANGNYTLTSGSEFRVATDLIVGGQDFNDGHGVIPYVAARVFTTTVQQLAGTSGGVYDLMTIDYPAGGGAAVTYAGTARVSGNTLSICQSSTAVTVTQNCPAASLQSYALTVNAEVYTGINTATAASTLHFQEAQIGATAALLSAEAVMADGSQHFIIGLPDASVVAGASTQGQSTNYGEISASLSSTLYSFASATVSDSAVLGRISAAAGPFSMLVGPLASDAAPIYVMQSYPLTVAVGGTSGAASGLLQVSIP